MTDKMIRGDSNEMLRQHLAMEHEEDEALKAMQAAALENRRKDAARYALRACDKTLADFELMGFKGFMVTRDADGLLCVEGVPHHLPAYLKETA